MKREEKGAIVTLKPDEILQWLIVKGVAHGTESIDTIEFNSDSDIEITLERGR